MTTLTIFTASIIGKLLALKNSDQKVKVLLLCGGGRKIKFYTSKENLSQINIKLIDEYGVNGIL